MGLSLAQNVGNQAVVRLVGTEGSSLVREVAGKREYCDGWVKNREGERDGKEKESQKR